jgi:hypothetical protein
MNRRAHERGAYRVATGDQPRQLIRLEPVEPRPERDVGIARHLRLHADEILDRPRYGSFFTPQEELPR